MSAYFLKHHPEFLLAIVNLLRKLKIIYTDHMKYENLIRFNNGVFKRLVGVEFPRILFLKMLFVLR